MWIFTCMDKKIFLITPLPPPPSPSSDLAFTRGHFTVFGVPETLFLKIQIDEIEFDKDLKEIYFYCGYFA